MSLSQPKKVVGGAFGRFTDEKRSEFIKRCAGKPACEVQKLAGEEWKKLSDAEKEPYQKKYEAAKAKYEADLAAFVASGGEVAKIVKKSKKDKEGKNAKKTKDKDAPKGVAGGAYGQFLAAQREEIKKSLPADHKITDVSKKAGELWKALSEAEKEPYEKLYATKREEYVQAMKEYKATKAAEAPEPEAATPTPKKRKAEGSKAPSGTKPRLSGRGAKKPAGETESVDISEEVLKQAQKSGFEGSLLNLAKRPDVVASGKKDVDLLNALKGSEGLVNPAKRALLGA